MKLRLVGSAALPFAWFVWFAVSAFSRIAGYDATRKFFAFLCGLCSAISQHRHIPRRFYEEARKPRTIGKNSWFLGFLMKLILVAATPRCVSALKDFFAQDRGRSTFIRFRRDEG